MLYEDTQERTKSFEQLGIIPLEEVDEIFAFSDSVIEPALRTHDVELARSALTAVARILQNTGHISPSLAKSFILESERRIADLG